MSKRDEFTAGLRDLADWLDQHPELPDPYAIDGQTVTPLHLRIYINEYDNADVVAAFAAAVSALGGKRTKSPDDTAMDVTRHFAPGVAVTVWAQRSKVCEAVIVGTKTVEVEKVITPAVTETVTEERDIIEWRCAPVLGAAS